MKVNIDEPLDQSIYTFSGIECIDHGIAILAIAGME